MYVLVFQNDDGIQQVWTLEKTGRDLVAEADQIVRDFVNSVDALSYVDIDFEEGEEGKNLVATWAIGAEGEYFELWKETTVH